MLAQLRNDTAFCDMSVVERRFSWLSRACRVGIRLGLATGAKCNTDPGRWYCYKWAALEEGKVMGSRHGVLLLFRYPCYYHFESYLCFEVG